MRVLAIDPGFDRLGIAVVEKADGPEKVVFSECFLTDKADSFYVRLAAVGARVMEMIDTYGPDALALETLFFSTNAKTAMRVAEARGVIIYQAASQGIPVAEYSPQDVKIAVTGYGRATKNQVTDMARRLARLDPAKKTLDDEMDAIAVGLAHCAMYKTAGLR